MKTITALEAFATHAEALAHLATLESSRSRLVGTDPLRSPLPLAAMTSFRLVHESRGEESEEDAPLATDEPPELAIFEWSSAGS